MERILIALALAGSLNLHAQSSQSMFVFQKRFWLNLHQFLKGEAYRRSAKAAAGLDLAALKAGDRSVWISAVDSYKDIFNRSEAFDEDLRRMANALAMAEDGAPLPARLESVLGSNIENALNVLNWQAMLKK